MLTATIDVNNPGIATNVVDDLLAGKYYFAVGAAAASGTQSELSNVLKRTIG